MRSHGGGDGIGRNSGGDDALGTADARMKSLIMRPSRPVSKH